MSKHSLLTEVYIYVCNTKYLNDSGNSRRKYNIELYKLFRDVDFIKLNRTWWTDHLMGMECDRAALKNFNTVPFGQQLRDRPKKRWIGCLDSDLSVY